MKTTLTTFAAAIALALGAHAAFAAVTADQAAKLGTSLTPLGAEKAANADGSIPAWSGGYTKAPAGYKNGAPRPDPSPGRSRSFPSPPPTCPARRQAQRRREGPVQEISGLPPRRLSHPPQRRRAPVGL